MGEKNKTMEYSCIILAILYFIASPKIYVKITEYLQSNKADWYMSHAEQVPEVAESTKSKQNNKVSNFCYVFKIERFLKEFIATCIIIKKICKIPKNIIIFSSLIMTLFVGSTISMSHPEKSLEQLQHSVPTILFMLPSCILWVLKFGLAKDKVTADRYQFMAVCCSLVPIFSALQFIISLNQHPLALIYMTPLTIVAVLIAIGMLIFAIIFIGLCLYQFILFLLAFVTMAVVTMGYLAMLVLYFLIYVLYAFTAVLAHLNFLLYIIWNVGVDLISKNREFTASKDYWSTQKYFKK